MNQNKEENVIFYPDEVELLKDGKIKHHPLEYLYRFFDDKSRTPANLNELAFAGDNLYRSIILNDIHLYNLKFLGEAEEIRDREAWADPLRAKVLRRLSCENCSWYLGFVGHYTIQLFEQDGRSVPLELVEYFSKKDAAQITDVSTREPFGYGKGLITKLFFEIPNHEIDWVVRNIWTNALQAYSIEGYNFTSGCIDLLRDWGDRPKDEMLFREVVDKSQALFYTHPEEHRHFAFITNKYNPVEFQQILNLEDLRKQANMLLK